MTEAEKERAAVRHGRVGRMRQRVAARSEREAVVNYLDRLAETTWAALRCDNRNVEADSCHALVKSAARAISRAEHLKEGR